MKKFYYATDGAKGAHVLTVAENENIIAIAKKLDAVIVQPCKNVSEAVRIVELWKKAQA